MDRANFIDSDAAITAYWDHTSFDFWNTRGYPMSREVQNPEFMRAGDGLNRLDGWNTKLSPPTSLVTREVRLPVVMVVVLRNSAVLSPSRPVPPGHIVDIAVGQGHVVALDSTGAVFAWGSNLEGQVDKSSTEAYFTAPHKLGFDFNATRISAGGNSSAAVDADGSVHGWGFNGVAGE